VKLPEQFKVLIINVWGDRGRLWLDQLPETVAFFCSHWHLNTIVPFNNLSYNFVARAESTVYNKQVVLKIGVPSSHFMQEMKALQFYDGKGCVKLLAYNIDKAGMLLELIEPGITVRSFFPERDDEAVHYACMIMKQLHVPIIRNNTDFPTMEQWLSLFTMLEVPLEIQPHVEKALLFAQELKSTVQNEYLMHGDLHHDNILLSGTNSCIAIDPKGEIGEPAYDVGAFMCNPAELSAMPDLTSIMARRLDRFSQLLGIERQRLVKAAYVRIVLSACWTVQDNGDWRDDVRFAQLILTLG
jgi:streptomycin 6-kinase